MKQPENTETRIQFAERLKKSPDAVLRVADDVVDGYIATAKELEFIYQAGVLPMAEIRKKDADAMNRALKAVELPLAHDGKKIRSSDKPAQRYFIIRQLPDGQANWSDLIKSRTFWGVPNKIQQPAQQASTDMHIPDSQTESASRMRSNSTSFKMLRWTPLLILFACFLLAGWFMFYSYVRDQFADLRVQIQEIDRSSEFKITNLMRQIQRLEKMDSQQQSALFEIEQLLIIAEDQLRLSHNIQAAIDAMELAHTRLQVMSEDIPNISIVQKQIVADLMRLRLSLPQDRQELISLLQELVAAIDDLGTVEAQASTQVPLYQRDSTDDTHLQQIDRIFDSTLEWLEKMITIKKHHHVVAKQPAASIELVKANMIFDISQIYFAIFHQDQIIFDSAISRLVTRLNEHFDMTESSEVQRLLDLISQAHIQVETLLTIQSSIESIRALLRQPHNSF